jgi:mRNA-degrading endonuclease toxin of MazEF toxin-antitoxin module
MILSRQSSISVMQRVVAVPATRTIRGGPSELLLDEDDGMPSECVLAFDNITNVSKALFVEHICTIRGERLAEVCRAIERTTGC